MTARHRTNSVCVRACILRACMQLCVYVCTCVHVCMCTLTAPYMSDGWTSNRTFFLCRSGEGMVPGEGVSAANGGGGGAQEEAESGKSNRAHISLGEFSLYIHVCLGQRSKCSYCVGVLLY